MDLFKIRKSDETERRGRHILVIKQWVMRCLEMTEDSSVFITELQCSEPGCPPVETLIAIMNEPIRRRDGDAKLYEVERKQYKIHKPILDVTESDIEGIYLHCHAGRSGCI